MDIAVMYGATWQANVEKAVQVRAVATRQPTVLTEHRSWQCSTRARGLRWSGRNSFELSTRYLRHVSTLR